MNERLQYIRDYFKNQRIKVEIKAFYSKNLKGHTRIYRFTGTRAGIKFKDGLAEIDRNDLPKLVELYPELIIHEKE
ncbi:hypothetical protein JYA63_17385 [Fictibacillus nanhaiensis]|uniref:Uncharacterized protein n=1 Tax=Fictibacillus nanhaiensis TaxID=742169 RepID=A0ABS2ZX74_9BACL|nr:hypothetical protein [Fictibacillus nanhaiensis]